MEILLENPLATMYGPFFLVFYGFVIAFILIILGIKRLQVDQTNKIGLPPIPSRIDPYEIAYLRGGTNEMARSVVFSLIQKGCVEIDNNPTAPKIKRINNPVNRQSLNQIEQLALDWLGFERESKDIFQPNGLIAQLESFARVYQSRLEQQQLLTGEEMKSGMKVWKWAAFLTIFGLGAYKIFAAVMHGRFNIIFLVILGLIGLALAKAISNLPRITKLGKIYLERLQLAFDNLKLEAQRAYIPSNEPKAIPQTAFAGVDPLLLSVGLFGSGILAGTVFDSYNQAFHRAQQSAVSGDSCGSSCGSCSSSDGGGSSCGGGCGGCGGGCGG